MFRMLIVCGGPTISFNNSTILVPSKHFNSDIVNNVFNNGGTNVDLIKTKFPKHCSKPLQNKD